MGFRFMKVSATLRYSLRALFYRLALYVGIIKIGPKEISAPGDAGSFAAPRRAIRQTSWTV